MPIAKLPLEIEVTTCFFKDFLDFLNFPVMSVVLLVIFIEGKGLALLEPLLKTSCRSLLVYLYLLFIEVSLLAVFVLELTGLEAFL